MGDIQNLGMVQICKYYYDNDYSKDEFKYFQKKGNLVASYINDTKVFNFRLLNLKSFIDNYNENLYDGIVILDKDDNILYIG